MSFKESTPWFKEVFLLIDSTCKEMGIPLYLIGAQARHFHLVEHGIKPGRGTKDIDFAIMLPDIGTYNRVLDSLLEKGFRKVTEPCHPDRLGNQRKSKACKLYDLQAFLIFVKSIHIRKYHKKCELNGESFFILPSNSPEGLIFFSKFSLSSYETISI